MTTADQKALDERYMARCLALAEKGGASVRPNPKVGAVLLDTNGHIAVEGYHSFYGGPHAEVAVLNAAGERARGGTLYVNLEPCNHYGKTPPCTGLILASGIKRVVFGIHDPNPLVAGEGEKTLQAGGIDVTTNILPEACTKLNEKFLYAMRTSLPFVTLKLAMTLDGRIASRNQAGAEWMTSPESRQYVHALRNDHDAILTTASTVMADNPQPTVRQQIAPLSIATRPPIRIVLDRLARLNPSKFRVFETEPTEAGKASPTWVIVSRRVMDSPKISRLEKQGIRVLGVRETGQGLDLAELIQALGNNGITSLMTEAGGHLAGSLMNQSLVNKLVLFYAPLISADAYAPVAFSGKACFSLSGINPLNIDSVKRAAQDIIVEAYPKNA